MNKVLNSAKMQLALVAQLCIVAQLSLSAVFEEYSDHHKPQLCKLNGFLTNQNLSRQGM